MRFKYSYFFLPENVLKRAERQHNPALSASRPCAERGRGAGRASVSAWSSVPLPERGTSELHQHKQGDNLPLDLCTKNLNDIAEREREDLAKQAEGYRHYTAIKLAFNLSFTRCSIFLRNVIFARYQTQGSVK